MRSGQLSLSALRLFWARLCVWNSVLTDRNAGIIIKYIQDHLKKAQDIELWNTWMGEKEIETSKKCKADELLEKNVREIWGKDEFNNPECLKIT